MSLLDLMGKDFALTPEEKKRATQSPPKRYGYAAPPGTGPTGETCATCKHICRSRKFRKCALRRATWTHGFATDILAKAKACKFWEAPCV